MKLVEQLANKYAKQISKNETYQKYLQNAFIEGWDAALELAAKRVRIKVTDEILGNVIEYRDVDETIDLMDEVYQIDVDSIVSLKEIEA